MYQYGIDRARTTHGSIGSCIVHRYLVLRSKKRLHPAIDAETHKRRNNRTILTFPTARQSPHRQSISRLTHKGCLFISKIPGYQRYLMLGKRPRNSKAITVHNHTLSITRFCSFPSALDLTPTSNTCYLLERGEVWHPIAGPAIARGLARKATAPLSSTWDSGGLTARFSLVELEALLVTARRRPNNLGKKERLRARRSFIQLFSTPPRRELAAFSSACSPLCVLFLPEFNHQLHD